MITVIMFGLIGLLGIILLIINPCSKIIGLSILMLFFGVVTFVVTSVEKDITRKYIETDVEVRFTSRSAIIDDGIRIRSYDDYETVNELKDTTLVFYREETTNFWGYTTRSEGLFWGKGDKCDSCEPL